MAQTITNGVYQLKVDTTTEKIFHERVETIKMEYTNSTGAEKTLLAGLVIGRILIGGKALPLKSDATDGSQYPVGILFNESVTVANGATVTLTVANVGTVNKNGLIFENGTDTLATAVDGRQLGDRIVSDTQGIKLVELSEITRYDN